MTNRNPDARPTARDTAGALARLSRVPDATLPYSAAAERTEVFETPATTRTSRDPVGSTPPRPPLPRRRLVVIVASIAATILIAWLATVAVSSFAPPTQGGAPIDYPAVDGTLGTHLEQLQRSVEP